MNRHSLERAAQWAVIALAQREQLRSSARAPQHDVAESLRRSLREMQRELEDGMTAAPPQREPQYRAKTKKGKAK